MLVLFLLPAKVPALYQELKYSLFGKISQQAYNFSEKIYIFLLKVEMSPMILRLQVKQYISAALQ